MINLPQHRDASNLHITLTKAGLSPNEASVYLALLKLGQTGASAITQTANLHGQIVYRALDALKKAQLVEKVTVNNRARFTARSPQILLDKLDESRSELADTVATLENLHTANLADQISIAQGRDQFVARELEQMKHTPRDSEVLIISGIGHRYWDIMGEYMTEHDYIRHQRNITVRYVGSEPQRSLLDDRDQPLFKYRLLPYEFSGTVNTAIFPNALGTYIFTEPPTSLYVTNTTISQTHKTFFEALWKMGV